MGSPFPWDDDYVPFTIVPSKKKNEELFYAVRENFNDIPNDEDGKEVDFDIISGTEKELLDLGYPKSQIFQNEDLAFLSGAINHGYFSELLKDSSAYRAIYRPKPDN